MSIEGVNELNSKLNKLIKLENITKKAVNKGCKMVQDEAKLMCPVDKGELRNSIKTKVDVNGNEIIGTVYTNKKYAAYVEFGTGPTGEANHEGISPNANISYSRKGWGYKDKTTGEYRYTNGQAAQPYMYPALHNNIDTAMNIIKDNLREYIKEV